MMLFATVINYMDRQLLASVASFVKHDFQLLRNWILRGFGREGVSRPLFHHRLAPPHAHHPRLARSSSSRIRHTNTFTEALT